MHDTIFSEEFSHELSLLKQKAEKGNGEARYLLEIITNGLRKLEANHEAGKNIPKKLIPKQYFFEHNVTNLWKLNLDSYWRLIYTLKGSQIELRAIVIEVLDHKKYDRKFGYHT